MKTEVTRIIPQQARQNIVVYTDNLAIFGRNGKSTKRQETEKYWCENHINNTFIAFICIQIQFLISMQPHVISVRMSIVIFYWDLKVFLLFSWDIKMQLILAL